MATLSSISPNIAAFLWQTVFKDKSGRSDLALGAYLVSDGLFGWEVVGPYLWEGTLQLVVQPPELCVPPVHVPLVILYPNVDLPMRKRRREAESKLLISAPQGQVLHHPVHTPLGTEHLAQNGGPDGTNGHRRDSVWQVTGEHSCTECPHQSGATAQVHLPVHM